MFFVRKVETNGHGAEKDFCKGVAFPIKLRSEFAESGKGGFGGPDVGLVLVLFGSDFVAFLGFYEGDFFEIKR